MRTFLEPICLTFMVLLAFFLPLVFLSFFCFGTDMTLDFVFVCVCVIYFRLTLQLDNFTHWTLITIEVHCLFVCWSASRHLLDPLFLKPVGGLKCLCLVHSAKHSFYLHKFPRAFCTHTPSYRIHDLLLTFFRFNLFFVDETIYQYEIFLNQFFVYKNWVYCQTNRLFLLFFSMFG